MPCHEAEMGRVYKGTPDWKKSKKDAANSRISFDGFYSKLLSFPNPNLLNLTTP